MLPEFTTPAHSVVADPGVHRARPRSELWRTGKPVHRRDPQFVVVVVVGGVKTPSPNFIILLSFSVIIVGRPP